MSETAGTPADQGATTAAAAMATTTTGAVTGDNLTTGGSTSGQAAQPAAQATEQHTIKPEDVQGLVTRESRKAVEKLLRDAGIQAGDNPEAQLKDYKKWLDSQKTELELAQGNAQAAANERDAAKAELEAMRQTMAAIQKGVPPDRAARYVKLAETYMSDGSDLAAALDAAIKDFPLPKAEEGVKQRDVPVTTVPAKRGDGDKPPYVPPTVI